MRISVLIMIVGLFIANLDVNAQCRSFAKKSCETQLEDYMVNGRMYGGYVTQGQIMELLVVLNGGQQYRLINCSKPDLGEIQIQLFDSKGNLIFDNIDHELTQNWDFEVNSTQEFTIRTTIPSADRREGANARDCSILIIGSKSS